jgi:hypothetical protein
MSAPRLVPAVLACFLLAASSFGQPQGLPHCAVGWDRDFGEDGPRGTGTPLVNALADFDGFLFAGGVFNTVGPSECPISVNSVARWDPETGDWNDVDGGVTYSNRTRGIVRALAVFDGSLWVAGDFDEAGGIESQGIARWDETNGWQGVHAGDVVLMWTDFQGFALEVHDGDLFLGGFGPSVFCPGAVYVWSDGTESWEQIGGGWLNGSPNALRSLSGDLFVGGAIMFSCGALVRYDGSAVLDGESWGRLIECIDRTGAAIDVHAIESFDGLIWMGGIERFGEDDDCTNVHSWGGLQTWDASEENWEEVLVFAEGGEVQSMLVWDDCDEADPGTKLFVGGAVITPPGECDAAPIWRYTGREWLPVGSPGLDALEVYAMTLFHDGYNWTLVVGGVIGSADGNSVNNVARWGLDKYCYADFNKDGQINIFDFLAFQAAHTAEDPRADCNCDSSFNINDFLCFQGKVNVGCD